MVSPIVNLYASASILAPEKSLFTNRTVQSEIAAKNSELVRVLIAGIGGNNSGKSNIFGNQQDQLAQTLKQLSSANNEINSQRKEEAQRKIEQLKAQIRALRISAGGDPKATMRQAARLARELASAVRDYSGGSGGSASSVFSAGSSAQISAPAVSVTGEVGVAEVGTGTGAVTAPVSGVEEKTADIDSQSVAGIASSKEDSQVVASENEGRKNSPVSPQLGASEEDRNFANEARKLLNDLKNIIKNAKQKIHDETGAYSSTDVSEAEKALNETDVTLNQISEGAFSAPASVAVNILA